MSTYEELISTIEAKPYFAYSSQIASEFSKVIDWAIEQNAELSWKQANWEQKLFSLHTTTPLLSSNNSTTQRFEDYQLPDGSFWYVQEGFDEQAKRYFLSRMENTQNMFFRTRYADYLFEHGVESLGIKRFVIAKILVPSFIATAEIHLSPDHNNSFYGLADMYRAIEVALLMQNKELLNQGIGLLAQLLRRYVNSEEYRWVLELSKTLRLIQGSPLKHELPDEIRQSCLDALLKGVKVIENSDDPTNGAYFYSEMIEWGRFGFFTVDEIKHLQIAIGELYEKHAEKQDSFLAKAHFYEVALQHYVQQGMADKVDSMKVRIREAYRKLQTSGELKEAVVPIKFPDGFVENIHSTFVIDDLDEAIDKIVAGSHTFYPGVEDIENALGTIQEATPMLSFIHKSILGHERKIFQTETDEDLKQQAFANLYILDLLLRTEVFLVPIFQRLISENGLTADHVLRKLVAWPWIHPENLTLVTDGIQKFFNGDYVGCIHILAPQFESTLRRAFSLGGYPTTSLRRGAAQQEETFNAFLENLDVQRVLGIDLHQLIKMVMVDPLGLNLRNEVGHGLISIGNCNQSNCTKIVFLFLALSNTAIPDPNTTEN